MKKVKINDGFATRVNDAVTETEAALYTLKVTRNKQTLCEYVLTNKVKEITIDLHKDDVVNVSSVQKASDCGEISFKLIKNGKVVKKISDVIVDTLTFSEGIDQIRVKLTPAKEKYSTMLKTTLTNFNDDEEETSGDESTTLADEGDNDVGKETKFKLTPGLNSYSDVFHSTLSKHNGSVEERSEDDDSTTDEDEEESYGETHEDEKIIVGLTPDQRAMYSDLFDTVLPKPHSFEQDQTSDDTTEYTTEDEDKDNDED